MATHALIAAHQDQQGRLTGPAARLAETVRAQWKALCDSDTDMGEHHDQIETLIRLGAVLAVEPNASAEHDYLSTTCLHAMREPNPGLHARCRQVCKWCSARCRCACHARTGHDGPRRYLPSRLGRRRSGAPVLEREALISADIVAMNATGALYHRVHDAITAYVYAVENVREGRYPSDAEIAAAVAVARAERSR